MKSSARQRFARHERRGRHFYVPFSNPASLWVFIMRFIRPAAIGDVLVQFRVQRAKHLTVLHPRALNRIQAFLGRNIGRLLRRKRLGRISTPNRLLGGGEVEGTEDAVGAQEEVSVCCG